MRADGQPLPEHFKVDPSRKCVALFDATTTQREVYSKRQDYDVAVETVKTFRVHGNGGW